VNTLRLVDVAADGDYRLVAADLEQRLRVYRGAGAIPTVQNGLGVAIVTTPQGVMTDRKARANGVGGEVLCVVA
jgi:ribosomal protein S8